MLHSPSLNADTVAGDNLILSPRVEGGGEKRGEEW